jgi:uncharacterized protein (DUF1499 family)
MGASDGRLASCPNTPNCVNSQETGRSAVAPLAFNDSAAAALARLKRIVAALPRTRIVASTDSYLHAEVKSRIFGFVDDVEFLVDPLASQVHVRSASRVGYSDFGVNRARVETIRMRFTSR